MDNSNFNLFNNISKFSNNYGNEYIFKIMNILKKILHLLWLFVMKDKIPLCFFILNESNIMNMNLNM